MILKHRIKHQRSHKHDQHQERYELSVIDEEFANKGQVFAEKKKLLEFKRFSINQLETVVLAKPVPQAGSCSPRVRRKLTHHASSLGSDGRHVVSSEKHAALRNELRGQEAVAQLQNMHSTSSRDSSVGRYVGKELVEVAQLSKLLSAHTSSKAQGEPG